MYPNWYPKNFKLPILLEKNVEYRLYITKNNYKQKHWKSKYLCFCGNEFIKETKSIDTKYTKSCGCLKKHYDYYNKILLTKHGMCKYKGKNKSKLYHIWQSMKRRCYNEKNPHYDDYGKRGIIVCNEWKNNFIVFYQWAILNGYNEDSNEKGINILTIDRINNNGNYEPSNCRWATKQQQAKNKRKSIKNSIIEEIKKVIKSEKNDKEVRTIISNILFI